MKRWIVVVAFVALCVGAVTGSAQLSVGPAAGSSSPVPTITLPDTVINAVGHQFNIWYDQLNPVLPQQYAHYSLMFSQPTSADTVGARSLSRSWRWKPSGAVSFTLTAKAVDANAAMAGTATTRMTSVADNGGAEFGNLLFIGDSIPAGSTYLVPAAIDSLFRSGGGSQVNCIGTQSTVGKFNECRSGWGLTDFIGASSPFYAAGILNFRTYMKTNGTYTGAYSRSDSASVYRPASIDYAVIALGVNDILTALGKTPTAPLSGAQNDTIIAHYDRLIAATLNATTGFPTAKILVCLLSQPGADLWGYGLYTGDTATYPYYIKSVSALNARLVKRYDARAYNARVDVCAPNLNIDRIYGYSNLVPANSRTSGTELAVKNWIHPHSVGLYEMADAIYPFLRWESARKTNMNLLANSENFSTWTASPGSGWSGPTTTTAPDGASDAQVWTTDSGSESLFYKNTTSAYTIGTDNVMSCYFKYSGSGTDYPGLMIMSAGTGTPMYRGRWSLTSATDVAVIDQTGTGVMLGKAVAANGWVRLYVYFPGEAGQTGQQCYAYVYARVSTSGGVRTPGIWGAQFENGVKTPSAYFKKP